MTDEIRVADEVWIATALLQAEQPDRTSFKVAEIVQRAEHEALSLPLRSGVYQHAQIHCVANRPPSPNTLRMLFQTEDGGRRLFRNGDQAHPERSGKTAPIADQIPLRYHWLLERFGAGTDNTATIELVRENQSNIAPPTLPTVQVPHVNEAVEEQTAAEQASLALVLERVNTLRSFLIEQPQPEMSADLLESFAYLGAMRAIQGNFSNDLSFLATLLAKRYLIAKFTMHPFDVSAKAQGAPGLDIDAQTVDGKRVVGEIKTTVPYGGLSLGAAQLRTFQKDFAKLASADADYKFFFVTDAKTFYITRQKYAKYLTGVTIVQLTTGEDYPA